MVDSTGVDKDGINKAVGTLEKISSQDRMAVFDKLAEQWPDAGSFAAAQWVEKVVDDRRNAVIEHAHRLDTMFTDMKQKLRDIVQSLEGTDEQSAADIQALASKDVGAMKDDIRSGVSQYDAAQEAQQTNFSDDPDESAADNNGDGDGYDDNISGGGAGTGGTDTASADSGS